MKKPNITPGEWTQSRYAKGNVVSIMPNGSERSVAGCMGYSTNTGNGVHIEENMNNSELVIIAGNLTNKNFNIEAIEEMYEVLKEFKFLCLEWGKMHPDTAGNQAYKRLKQALKNAKYEE